MKRREQLTTGQVSKAYGLSVRTLRYYDQIGLLKPSHKEDHGKRLYSEEDLLTLEKITLLKSLSLPLEEIQRVLDTVSLRQLLIAHYNHLQEQAAELKTSIDNTVSLINMLDIEGSLTWDKVRSVVRNSKHSSKKWVEYFNEEEQKLLRRTLPALENHSQVTQQYSSLLRRIEWCISRRIPPESEEGAQIARELVSLSEETFGGDEALMDKFWEVRKQPAEQSGLYPISEEVLEFVERCMLQYKM